MADKVIGSYRITQTLGAGGMGAVYAGEHVKLGRKAAIKVLLPELSGNQELVERFFNEARAATAIKHPGIVQIYDLDYQDGSAYIAMEYLEGEGLDARLKRLGRLPVQQALRFTGQIASALAVAHGRGIVHRDLKPANLFIVPDAQVVGGERIKILDFGIAKIARTSEQGPGALTQAGTLMGSPSYMAPEQCRGAADADHRADLYSVGCILFECLCGRPPFLAGDGGYIAILAAHLNDPPPVPSSLRPDLTSEIDNLVLHLLVKEPYARPETAAHVAHAVSVLSGEQVSFGSMSAVTEVFDGSTGLDAITAQGTSPGSGRLIDQITSRGRRSTGGVTGAMSAGITGRNTDGGGGIAAAQRTARSRLSHQRLPTQASRPGSRRALWAGAALLVIGLGVAFSQLGNRAQPTQPTAAAVRVEPAAVPAPAPEPAREPSPKLNFYAMVDQPAGGRARVPVATVAAVPAVMRLPTLSWTSLFSGSFFTSLASNLDSLVASLSVSAKPEPVLITWTIATSPPGAEVLCGDQKGSTAQPLIIEVEQTPGFSMTCTLRLERYRDATIELHGDKTFDQVIELEPKLFAKIDSRPAGAQVLNAQGAPVGTTPIEIEIDPATATAWTLKLDRHEDATLDLSGDLAADIAGLQPGKKPGAKIEKLVKLVPKVYATVTSRPAGAEVFDAQGVSLGAAPREIELPRGPDGAVTTAAVTLKLDRHEDAAVELEGAKSFRKDVKLVPKIFATVTSKPAGAQVLDAQGQALGVTPVTFELARAAQPGRVTVKLDGHMDAEAVLRGGRSFTRDVKLVARPKLTIVSAPAGAQVIDAQGQPLGAAPVEVLLSGKGEPVAFTLKLDGHRDERVEVKTRRDQTVRANLAPVLGPVTVRIESKPAGAEVWKQGKMIGRAPMDDQFEGTGVEQRYTLKLDGYEERSVRVPGDRAASELVELRKCPAQRSGQLGIVTVYGGC